MNRRRLFSIGLMVLGFFLLIIGSVASLYQEMQIFSGGGMSNGEIVTPYRDEGIVLVLAGIVFMTLGFVIGIV
jgi:hypothetical protein